MKKKTKIALAIVATLATIGGIAAKTILTEPTQKEYMGFILTHHANFMKDQAVQSGGTNKFEHTRQLPTEGTDNVVTPALDHIYSKAVIDLTAGPVFYKLPEVAVDRYFSHHITDQEHYTLMAEYHPAGEYAVVRAGTDYQWVIDQLGADSVTVSPSDYPHLFIRTQVYNQADIANVLPIQDATQFTRNPVSNILEFDNAIAWVSTTHDVYPENKTTVASLKGYSQFDYKIDSVKVGAAFMQGKIEVLNNIGLYNGIEDATTDHGPRAIGVIGHLAFPEWHAYYEPFRADCNDDKFDGSKVYTLTLPYDAKVEHFWSVTRYDADTRNTYPNTIDLYNAYNTESDADGNITITFSSVDPQDGSYWMPVHHNKGFYYVVRYYGIDDNSLLARKLNCGS
ncbi:DUF1214 domain-containing protein [Psychromonas ossibalaenae]|uniref:DUF1214 domain-containing protein n=1 Tax=Psychromonas ossibalaenae TaxID=444922 RepID=UPI000371D002|nr:DUF1214 domain-containing protein [Psychromonas ossibalaenae]